MNSRFKKILTGFAAFALAIAMIAPVGAEAATAKAKVKKLVKNMSSYEYTVLFGSGLETGEKKDIKLNARAKAIAATLAANLKNAVVEESEEFYTTYFIKSSTVKKMSKKLFGKAVSDKKLPVMKSEDVRGFLSAYRTEKGRAVVYCWEYETETDHEVISTKIAKKGSGFVVTRNVYYGYWGGNDHKTANYSVTYTVEKNAKSSFGYAITGMSIEKIG